MATFLILAHRDLKHLLLLIESLSGHRIFVHVDRKSKKLRKEIDLLPFNPKVTILNQEKCVNIKWGGFTQVQAMLVLIQEALPMMKNEEKLMFLSGSDMLIQSSAMLSKVLDHEPHREFLRYFPLDARKKDLRRWRSYHRWDLRFLSKKRGGIIYRANSLFIRIMGIFETILRGAKMNPGFELFSGSQWFAVSKECAEEILRLRSKSFDKFFESMFAPDEVYFATLFSLSSFSKANVDGGPMLCHNGISRVWQARNLTYVDESLDRWLNLEDLDSIRESGFIFARKFDSELSRDLIAELRKS